MARRRGLDRDDVIAAAIRIVDTDGLDALSLKGVADALGVQSPSLYSHVDGLNGLLDDCFAFIVNSSLPIKFKYWFFNHLHSFLRKIYTFPR